MKKDLQQSDGDIGRTDTAEATNKRKKDKAKSKHGFWPLKVCIITLCLSFAVNAGSTLVLEDTHLWLAILLTLGIVLLGVIFDIIGTASTACDIEPFLAMASRKVRGAKTAVKLARSSSVVSSVCNDVIGDVCGVVSGVCGATIVSGITDGNFWISVLIYAVISTLTITAKALGKGFAVKKSNDIILFVARALCIFKKEDK